MENNVPLDQRASTNELSNVALDERFSPAQEEQVAPRLGDAEDIFLATGRDDLDSTQAKVEVASNQQDFLQGIIDDAFLTQEMQAEKLQIRAENSRVKTEDFMGNPDFYYEQAVAQRQPDVSSQDIRIAVNQRIEREVLAEMKAREDASGGAVDSVLDFGSMMIREGTVGIVESLTDRTERKGTELLFNRITMSPSEYKDFFTSYATEARTEGLRNDTSWSLMQLEDEVFSSGFDQASGVKKAFAILDAIGVGQLAKPTLKLATGLARSTTKLGRVAAVEGVEASAEAGVKVLGRGVDPQVQADMGPGSLNPHQQPLGPPEDWYTNAYARSSLVKEVEEIQKSGALGRVVPEEVLQAKKASILDEYTARVGSPVYRSSIDALELGRYVFRAQFGNPNTGLPFKPMPDGSVPKGVTKLADENGGVVKAVDGDPRNGYVVEAQENLDTSKYIKEINPDELLAMQGGFLRNTAGKFFGNSWMGSAAARGVERITSLAQMGEAGQLAIKRAFSNEAKKIESLSFTDRSHVNTVVGNLRDGVGQSQRRTWYTPAEFEIKYKEVSGSLPSQKIKDAYDALVNISDASAVIKANNLMQRYVRLDYKAIGIDEGIRVPGKKVNVSKVTKNDPIFDGEFGGIVWLDSLDDIDKQSLWKLDKPTRGDAEYVVRPKSVGELEPGDVMGYNAGGPRTNPNAAYFVTVAGARIKSLLTTFTEKDAKLAAQEIDNLRKADLGKNLTDDVLHANRTWNPNLETVDDLREFMRVHKWKFDKDAPIGVKPRDQKVDLLEVNGDEASAGMTMGQYIDNDMRRMDTVLPEFGGNKSYNVDPVSTIGAQFGNATQEFAFHAYTHNAMVGWVKEAQRRGRNWFPDTIDANDYRNMFLSADITGTDDFAIRMREIHNTEKRRMNVKSDAAKSMEALGQKMQEHVFDTSRKLAGKGLVTNLKQDPSTLLLNVGFQAAFGFLNASQLLVQSSHAMVIMAASPTAGFKGASMALALRGIYHTTPEAIEEAAKRAAKHYNMTTEEVKEIMQYVRTSGRLEIDGDAIEQGTGVGTGISGFGGESYNPSALRKGWEKTKKTTKSGMDVGLTPFNTGERLARSTSLYTAIMEWKAKNPGIPLNSDSARRWITRRDQDLSFNMTTSSRPLIQSGVMRVPTQWLSHSFRAMETIFVGRNFTKAERARMFAMMVPFYGLSGFGAQNAASQIGDMFGMEPDSAAFTTLKWGAIDGLTDWLMPDGVGREGTGLATRLTPMGAVLDTYRLINEGSFGEVAFGPSGGIAKGIFDVFADGAGDLLYGRDVMLTEDIIKLLRQPSGVDNVAKAIGIFNNGVYRSKNGVTIPGEMSVSEGILALGGVGSLKQTEWYNSQSQMYRSERSFRNYRKEINLEAERAIEMLRNPDTQERALEMFRELHTKVTLSGYPQHQVAQLRGSINTRLEDKWGDMQDWMLQTDRQTDQQRLGQVLGRFD